MFLLKPHVTGREGQVTSPDVIVDAVLVDGEQRPTVCVTHECWQQAARDIDLRPAYCIMALGGGALILPGVTLSTGLVVVSRQAWRLAHVDDHIDQITLNDMPLAKVGMPKSLIESAGGTEDALPRGFLLVRTVEESDDKAVLHDPVLDRTISHRLCIVPLDEDRWGDDRPRPRYSVGPTQQEVTHYI